MTTNAQHAQHAPGPWKIEELKDKYGKPGLWLHSTNPEKTVFDTTAMDVWPLSEADRLLIEAAPDLLNQLQRALDIILRQCGTEFQPWCAETTQLIARATGR